MQIARQQGFEASLVEKDYVLRWLLYGLSQSEGARHLPLKGGTALRVVYFPHLWRFSVDLDFSLIPPGPAVTDWVKEGLQRATQASQITFRLLHVHRAPAHLILQVQYHGPLQFPNRLRLDVSLKEPVLTPVKRVLVKGFYDVPAMRVPVYSREEILAEKLRSILQRGKSRDYYDVWLLLKQQHFDLKKIGKLLQRKCAAVDLDYQPEQLLAPAKIEIIQSFWRRGLGHLVRELPPVEEVLKELRKQLAGLY